MSHHSITKCSQNVSITLGIHQHLKMCISYSITVRSKDLARYAKNSLYRSGGGSHTEELLGQLNKTGHPAFIALSVGQWAGTADDAHLTKQKHEQEIRICLIGITKHNISYIPYTHFQSTEKQTGNNMLYSMKIKS